MSRTRRARLARQLAADSDLTYQQALDRLDAYVTAHGQLPRTATELAAVTERPVVEGVPAMSAAAGSGDAAAGRCAFCGRPATHTGVYMHNAGAATLTCDEHAAELLRPYRLGATTLRLRDIAEFRDRPVTAFTIRYSALSSCPHMVMSVAHWLPTGVCAHSEPPCPTCAGAGILADGHGTMVCGTDAPLPPGVPVCGGTGTWTGART